MPLQPNQLISKTNLTLQDAIDNSKPIPPWKRKLMNDLKGNINSSTVIVEGVNDTPTIPAVVKRPVKNPRRWLNIVRVILLLIHWLFVLITNVFDLISDAIGEITINLANFISNNAKTEPPGQQPTD